MKESELEYLLELYFSGRINSKLDYLKQKYKEPFSDDYYCSLKTPCLDKVGKNLTNKVNDPTGGIAVKLADIKLSQRRNYKYYLKFYQIMNKYIKKLDRFLADNMKIYLGLVDSPLFLNEEKEVLQHFEKIKKILINNKILEKEKKVDPYKKILEESKSEPEEIKLEETESEFDFGLSRYGFR